MKVFGAAAGEGAGLGCRIETGRGSGWAGSQQRWRWGWDSTGLLKDFQIGKHEVPTEGVKGRREKHHHGSVHAVSGRKRELSVSTGAAA